MLTILGLMLAVVTPMPEDLGPAPGAEPRPVVFICEHGSVKSLIAREWFNRLAAERGLSVRAISRGIAPDAAVPDAIVSALRSDGFDVKGFVPDRVDGATLAGAARVVAIGLERAALPVSQSTAVETWEGIPPATVQYTAARDAMRVRIDVLLQALEASGDR